MPPRICAKISWLFIVSLFLIGSGCGSTNSTAPVNSGNASAAPAVTTSSPAGPAATAVKSRVDICALLTSDDLKGVQGEPLKEARRSDQLAGKLVVAQCYYELATAANSVVLNVTTANEGDRDSNLRSFWQEAFGRKEEKDSEREREAARKTNARKEGAEEAEGAPKEKVAGLGEDAYWVASSVGGALYVLKKDVFFRLSVGGAGDQKARLKKSKTLAQQVLKRI
jgi:hypothetical protein